MESPHLASSGESVKILALKARPDRSEFVTFGADDTLRVWQPVVRHGGSVRTQNRSDLMEHTWKSQHSVRLVGYSGSNASKQKSPSRVVSFSDDGSIVAVCMKNAIHLIDTRQWTVHCSRNAFTLEKIRTIGFLGRYLVILSEQSLAIWNIVDDVLQTPVKPGIASQGTSHKYIALATDPSANTFAVVTSTVSSANEQGRNTTYGIAVYSPSAMTASFETALEKPPLALLADSGAGGYIVIDQVANIWRLGGENTKSRGLALAASQEEEHAAAGFGDIFGRLGQNALAEGKTSAQTTTDTTLSLQNLGGIFDRAPPFALPPATALFKDVINSLVSRT